MVESEAFLTDPNTLMGKNTTGGGKRRRSMKPKSMKPKSMKPKSMKPKLVKPRTTYRGGFFFNNPPGEEYKCYSCVKVAPPENPVVVNSTQSVADVNVKAPEPPVQSTNQSGGGNQVAKTLYKKRLNALDVDKLRKMAINRGIHITKKKNGKTVYVKKATIIQKLCDFKHGK